MDPKVWEQGLFTEQVLSLPEQQLHASTFQWGWIVRGQGYGEEMEGGREGWQVLSTPCSRWIQREMGI